VSVSSRPAVPDSRAAKRSPTESGERGRPLAVWSVRLAAAAAIVAGVALRFLTTSELWLDEALSVNIAALPLPELFAALRQDGHPPLYYVLLHAWMVPFGDGNLAVRALSGVLGVGALPLIWLCGKRLGAARVGWAALLLLASSPYAVRYATEARMYTLLVVFTLLGFLALTATLERPTAPRLVAVALLSGMLALTHYWALFLLATVVLLLLVRAAARVGRASSLAALGAVAAGGLLFLPWLPSFLVQLAHTGTPWGETGRPSAVAAAIVTFAGGVNDFGIPLVMVFFGACALALFGTQVATRRLQFDLRPRPTATQLAGVVFGTLALAIGVSMVVGSAYHARYAAVVLGPFLLLVAMGLGVLTHRPLYRGALAVAVVLGLAGGIPNITEQRTQAGIVAAAINAHAEDGDVIVYCPDQLGPAHHRLVRDGLAQVRFPDEGAAVRVDWTDYAARNRRASAAAFADRVHRRAGDFGGVWLVWQESYQTLGAKCEALADRLGDLRATARPIVGEGRGFYESARLVYFPGRAEPHEGLVR